MCGIAAAVAHDPVAMPTIDDLLAMTAPMRHRGPDDAGHLLVASEGTGHLLVAPEGTGAGARIGLGHRRLAVLDPSPAGHQPMTYAGGRYAITFNGAIYNHTELRDQLRERGYRFRSATDTEVVLAAYDLWGPECLSRFNGMWALVLADRVAQQVFVARDRFGIKPLFLLSNSEETLLASDVRALLAHPRVPTSPDEVFLAQCAIGEARCWEPATAFAGITRFPAAHYAVVRPGEPTVTPVRYWQLQPNTAAERFDADRAERYAQRYLELLEQAVAIRSRADVPVGIALSGGLDSSSILALAAALPGQARPGQIPSPRSPSRASTRIRRSPSSTRANGSRWLPRHAAPARTRSSPQPPMSLDCTTRR